MTMNRTITVSCLKSDPLAFGVQKYDNVATWNSAGGCAPNGVSATRYLRRTSPDASTLSALAAWLVTNLPDGVAGKMKRMTGNLRCEGRETECNALRRQQPRRAENIIKCYAIPEDQPTIIESWLFPQINPAESDVDYWNRVAREIVASNTARVSIDRGPSFEVQS